MSTTGVFSSYFGDGPGGDLYARLRDAIGESSRRLWISVGWWDTSPMASQLLDDVIAAHRRGVHVRVFGRSEASNDAAFNRLRTAGIEVIPLRNIHEKNVLADDLAVTQSSNFSNKELAVNENSGNFDDRVSAVRSLEAQFEHLAANRDALSVGQERWTAATELIPPTLRRFLDRYDTLNPLQASAVPAVLSTTGHILVVAPTSSGKTLIGEVAALRAIVQERRPAVWLLPARALAAEVAATAARWRAHGIDSIILTGEVNLSSDRARQAQLWVATTEKFEAMYRRSTLRDFMDRVGCLVIDEVHLVGDPERGATLESLLARLRLAQARTRIVALSATVANVEELASWLNATPISVAWRPTVLTTQIIPYRPGAGDNEATRDQAGKDAALSRLLADLRAAGPNREDGTKSGSDAVGSVLIFCGSKPAVRRTARNLIHEHTRNDDDATLVGKAFERGVGIHFRDAPHAARALTAFNNRKIGTMVATSGLSTGINTPAQIVVIRDLTLGKNDLEVSQAQQMLGRAGRAGQGELEGFGFLLVPCDKEIDWRTKLDAGYRVDSQLHNQIDDALLAEILLGSVTSRADATVWFKGTFAFAQTGELHDVDALIDSFITHQLVTDTAGRLAVTESGQITARLMIGVTAACNMLTAIGQLPLPADASDAENRIIQLVVNNVPALREWPVNSRVYQDWVEYTLAACGDAIDTDLGDDFGSQFAAATACAALRAPHRLSVPRGSTMSRGDLTRVAAELPRYLGWLRALGELGIATWPPAVAGDLSRRLRWWHLDPHPERGAGRLLWLLEPLLDPAHLDTRMPGLWNRARANNFAEPNRINTRPRDVDIDARSFDELISKRAHLALEPADSTRLTIKASPYRAHLSITTTDGTARAYSTLEVLGQPIDLPVPHRSRRRELAADLILYARSGDLAYQNLTSDIPEDTHATRATAHAATLIERLNPPAVVTSKRSGLIRAFRSDRTNALTDLQPQIAAEPQLTPVANALADNAPDVETQLANIRLGLDELLTHTTGSGPGPTRSASAILKSGQATTWERECVILVLARALAITTGIALADDNSLIVLAEINGHWHTVTPFDTSTRTITQPLDPTSLPPALTPVTLTSPTHDARPLYPWLAEFTPGSGAPPSSPRQRDITPQKPRRAPSSHLVEPTTTVTQSSPPASTSTFDTDDDTDTDDDIGQDDDDVYDEDDEEDDWGPDESTLCPRCYEPNPDDDEESPCEVCGHLICPSCNTCANCELDDDRCPRCGTSRSFDEIANDKLICAFCDPTGQQD